MTPLFRPLLRLGVILVLAATLSGCASSLFAPVSCAPVTLVNGQQLALSRADYISVEPKLAAYLAERRLVLVSDITKAEMLVTIDYERDPVDPSRTNVVVMQIEENHFNPVARGRNRDSLHNVSPPPRLADGRN